MCEPSHSHTLTNACTHSFTQLQTHTHTCTHLCMLTNTHACTHTHLDTHSHKVYIPIRESDFLKCFVKQAEKIKVRYWHYRFWFKKCLVSLNVDFRNQVGWFLCGAQNKQTCIMVARISLPKINYKDTHPDMCHGSYCNWQYYVHLSFGESSRSSLTKLSDGSLHINSNNILYVRTLVLLPFYAYMYNCEQ